MMSAFLCTSMWSVMAIASSPSFHASLTRADGPHLSVGDVGMDVEIAFERDIAADVGYAEVLAVVLAADGLMDVDIVVMQLCGGGQGTEKGKKCEGKVFSHRSCSLVVSY